jgi:hypothetical protein
MSNYTQMQNWLNRAVNEGKVRKTNKPVAYIIINQPTTQLSLEQILDENWFPNH